MCYFLFLTSQEYTLGLFAVHHYQYTDNDGLAGNCYLLHTDNYGPLGLGDSNASGWPHLGYTVRAFKKRTAGP